MRPLRRSGVSKKRSIRKFSRGTTRTQRVNVAQSPQRGGWRL